MCLFTEDDLFTFVNDPQIFALFKLSEREKLIIQLHLLKGYSFKVIAGTQTTTPQMIHKIYLRTIKKMKTQITEIVKTKALLQQGSN